VPRQPIHFMLSCYVPIISEDMAYLEELPVAEITMRESVFCGPRCWTAGAGDDAFNVFCAETGVGKQVPRCGSWDLDSTVDEVRICTYCQPFSPGTGDLWSESRGRQPCPQESRH